MKNLGLIFLLLTVLLGSSQNVKLQEGDLIFQTIDCGPLCDAINQVTEGYKGIDFNHVGMVVAKDTALFVLEASGKGVSLTSYQAFIKKTKAPMYVGRLKKRFKNLIPDAVNYGITQLGVPYDHAYIYDNGMYYCSELIYDCFLKAQGKPLFKLYSMTYKTPGSNVYFKVWDEYFKALNIDIPEGKPGCNPGGMSRSKALTIIGFI